MNLNTTTQPPACRLPRSLSLIAVASFVCLTATAQVDSTGWVDDMNRPLENGSDHYPRNAWDLHLWDGRIYVGWGNSASGGPSPNSNSVTILSFNPTTNQWVAEYQTNTCQVDVFRELDGQLVVPDHQSRDTGNRGGFYRLGVGGWERRVTMGNMAHNYDMAFFEGKYYAVLGDSYGDTVPGPRMAFRASEDAGQTWTDPILFKGRLYTIFEFQGFLHAIDGLGSGQYPTLETRAGVTSYRYDLTGATGFPGSTRSSKMHRPVVFNGRLLYLGGQPWNDHQTNPFDAFSAASLRPGAISVARIALPSNEKPWDFLVRGSKAYLLTSEKLATTPETFRVRVRESTDGIVFTELLRFTEWTFARSLELHNGYFYFGLGTDIGSDFATVLGPSYTATRSPFAGYLRRVPVDASQRPAIVMDNTSSGVTLTGAWLTSNATIGYIGASYIHDNNAGKGSKSVRFTPVIPSAGQYEVAIRYSTASSRATNVPVTVTHAAGTAQHSINQTQNFNGKWKVLGTYQFAAGSAGNVLISNTGTSSFVTVDAVAFRPMPAVAPPQEVILDNTATLAQGLTVTGNWTAATTTPGYIGSNYLHDGNAGKGLKSVRYAPTLNAGTYEVSARYTSGTNRASNVPIDVTHLGGVDSVAVSQQTGGGQWVVLGTYSFASGSSGSVLISNTGTNGHVIADAVKFTPAGAGNGTGPVEVIKDNTDASGVAVTGTWVAATTTPGYQGTNYLHDDNTGKGSKSVRYTPDLPQAGTYEVFIRYTSGSNRSAAVPVSITHSGGTANVNVNQQSGGGTWVSLGSYSFAAGTAGNILVSTTGTTGFVIADAIRFVKP